MSYLTIFTAPKPFTDPHINVIQRNAIRSWVALGEDVEVFLMGNDEGVAEAAAEFGVRHFPDVATNEKGIPYISDMLSLAYLNSNTSVLAIVNTDIILMPDFVQAARDAQAEFPQFMLAGQRWDLDITKPLEFGPGWQEKLLQDVTSQGERHPPTGSDYFIFTREYITKIPEFTIGRAGWDNWMIYNAVEGDWPILDASKDITIVHQNHDYSHLPGGQGHYKLPDSKTNVELAGGDQNMYLLLDVEQVLTNGEVRRKPYSWIRIIRFIEHIITPRKEIRGVQGRVFRALRRYRRRLMNG
jgi:hypothetical protein